MPSFIIVSLIIVVGLFFVLLTGHLLHLHVCLICRDSSLYYVQSRILKYFSSFTGK